MIRDLVRTSAPARAARACGLGSTGFPSRGTGFAIRVQLEGFVIKGGGFVVRVRICGGCAICGNVRKALGRGFRTIQRIHRLPRLCTHMGVPGCGREVPQGCSGVLSGVLPAGYSRLSGPDLPAGGSGCGCSATCPPRACRGRAPRGCRTGTR